MHHMNIKPFRIKSFDGMVKEGSKIDNFRDHFTIALQKAIVDTSVSEICFKLNGTLETTSISRKKLSLLKRGLLSQDKEPEKEKETEKGKTTSLVRTRF